MKKLFAELDIIRLAGDVITASGNTGGAGGNEGSSDCTDDPEWA